LLIVSAEHWTVVVAEACTETAFAAESVAVLAYAAQLDVEVLLVTWTDAVALGARLPKLQLSAVPVSVQLPGPLYELRPQLIPIPVGKVSVRVADVAVPAPLLPAVSVYPIDAPAGTVAASAVFVSVNVGHCTVVVAEACTEVLLLAESVAVLAYAAQLDVEVLLITWTVAVVLGTRLPKLQLRAVPVSVQLPGPLYGLMLQIIPVPVGRVSASVTDVAAPAPLLPAVSVYPIDAPAVTVAASAVFVRVNVGHCTVVVADACTEAAFVAENVAVLAYTAQLDVEVLLVMWTDAVAFGARLPKLQLSAVPVSVQLPGPL
jgi:hypothetical protein